MAGKDRLEACLPRTAGTAILRGLGFVGCLGAFDAVRAHAAVWGQPADPGRFGVTVAANAGMVTGVFAEEAEALEWLLGG